MDEQGFVTVDDRFCTNVHGFSAIGDVVRIDGRPHPQLAHLSSMEGIVLVERLANQETRPIDYDQVPARTYCDPEIGRVGLTERDAVARGFQVRTGTFPFGVLGRARIAGEVEGFVVRTIHAHPTMSEAIGEAAHALHGGAIHL
jgi:dihydrolipoamide dehydrogenase